MPSLGDVNSSGKHNEVRLLKWYLKPGEKIVYDGSLCDIEVILTEERGASERGLNGTGCGKIGDGIIFTLQSEDEGIMGPCVKSVEDCPSDDGRVNEGEIICEIWQTAAEAKETEENDEEEEAIWQEDLLKQKNLQQEKLEKKEREEKMRAHDQKKKGA